MLNFKQRYEAILPTISKTHNIKNVMALPKIKKITINTALNASALDKNYLAAAEKALTLISGQKCIIVKAKKSIAAFKTREGMNSGLMVTLRGKKMHEFLDRLIYVNLPRIKDFHGLKKSAIDSSGNYNIGIKDCTVFHEIEYGMLSKGFGFNISINISNTQKDCIVDLLKGIMLPVK